MSTRFILALGVVTGSCIKPGLRGRIVGSTITGEAQSYIRLGATTHTGPVQVGAGTQVSDAFNSNWATGTSVSGSWIPANIPIDENTIVGVVGGPVDVLLSVEVS